MKQASLFLAASALLVTAVCAEPAKIKCLIIDGQNNHSWQETTPVLKAILEHSGVFSVDVSTSPPNNANPDWAKWQPHFADYGVIVSNYNGQAWPKELHDALVSYVKNGGGFVSYHAADNSFGDQADYNEMIGLGGWGGRNAKSGPYLRLRDGEWRPLDGPGPCGGHGPQNEFIIETFAPEHPIMKGLPAQWMHAKDELYHSLRGPAKNLSVLGHALSEQTKEQEPMLMAISYGKGRVFHTTLGHYLEALDGLGFQVTLTRGTEWAATGKVTQPAPKPGELTAGPKAALRPLKPVPPSK
ncbi:MAG: ThuA domain-containing protein [Akkermansiaceae bacterium]|nr:ThuA domain-containing protein [Akkermansiaceae bacterium]MCF7730140.1 ThuA domain-containing protein [Akkermansiaceae bacterium]